MFLGPPLPPNLVRKDILSGTNFPDLFNTGVKMLNSLATCIQFYCRLFVESKSALKDKHTTLLAQLYNFCIQATANVSCLHSKPLLAGPVLSPHDDWLFQHFLFIKPSPAHAPSADLKHCECVLCCGICVSASCARIEYTSLMRMRDSSNPR